jgi:hypothetical protein
MKEVREGGIKDERKERMEERMDGRTKRRKDGIEERKAYKA